MRGCFVIYPDSPREQRIWNNVLDEGEQSFLKMIFRDDQVDVPGGNNFFVGLCGDDFEEDDTLATLTGEPSGAGGYARKSIARSAVGWPTLSTVNGVYRMQSLTVTWLPAGANYSVAIQRMFLCNVAAGTVGLLFAVSGALPAPVTLLDGIAFDARYEFYLR